MAFAFPMKTQKEVMAASMDTEIKNAVNTQPEFAGLVGSHGDAQDILIPFCGNTKDDISGTADDTSVLPDLIMNAVHKHKRIDWV